MHVWQTPPPAQAQSEARDPKPTELCLKLKDLLYLWLLTFAALLIHGYHPGIEDAEIYRAGIEKAINPALFPLRTEFFQSHAHLSLYAKLIALSDRVTHLPVDWLFFLWHLLSVFLFLLACWELTGKVFSDRKARWAGVALMASVLTLVIGGTGLYVLDEYLNPRNLSAFSTVFAIVRVLERKYFQAAVFLAFTAAMHPFMAVFITVYCLVLVWMERLLPGIPASVVFSPITFLYKPPSYAYEQVLANHHFHYVQRWAWYELLGGIAPFFFLGWFSSVALARQGRASSPEEASRMRNLRLMCRALIFYGITSYAAALVLDLPRQFETLARLQPMRMLFVTYILFILFSGGLLAEYVLKNRAWRWFLFFAPIVAAMFYSQCALFPGSQHIEWPGVAPKNQWVQAFNWIRQNTPNNAVFALDPNYMNLLNEDENGFRAVAERSRMADYAKDRGVTTMFPALANEWLTQTQALHNWKNFGIPDLERLNQTYGVDWVVLQQPGIPGLACPYQNAAVRVCRVP